MPRWIIPTMLVLVLAGAIPAALIAHSRASTSTRPRVHVIFDMDNQEKYKSQRANPAFADGRAMRLPPPGTVARGELREDRHFYEGRDEQGAWAATFPMELTREVLERGRERYAIYCTPCHGYSGYGDGTVATRSVQILPASFHSPDVTPRTSPGQVFNTITHGRGNMGPYRDQVPPADRWAIAAYVKALQKSQAATIEDVPPEERRRLSSERR